MERESIFDTATENTDSIVNSLLKETTINDFLKRDFPIWTHSTNISFAEQNDILQISYDTDGIVLGLDGLQSIKFGIPHINLYEKNPFTLKSVFNVLKKHITFNGNVHAFNNLKHLKGFQLFYEYGWEGYITLIPTSNKIISEKCLTDNLQEYLIKLRSHWQTSLQSLGSSGYCLNSLQKNSIACSKRLRILPDDQCMIFATLDKGFTECLTSLSSKPYLFVFRFGERFRGTVDLGKDFHVNKITSQSIHIALTLTTAVEIDLAWSRTGIQNIVGERGCISSCLSIYEAGNFQSNIDGRLLDVSRDIRNIISCPSHVNFVQFYCDIPHVRPNVRFHPVSGSIVNCGMLHENSLKSIEKDATKYLSVLKENIENLYRLKCRIEFAINPFQTIDRIESSKFFNIKHLSNLLQREPLIVPFDNTSQVFTNSLKAIGFSLLSQLETCFINGKRLGKYDETWKAFQIELAIEKIIWGKPFSPRNSNLSINLGPGVLTPSRSKTDWLGFISLEEHNCTSLDESPPPLGIWINSPKVVVEITSLFGFYDYVDACHSVVGVNCLLIILRDLFESKSVFRDRYGFNKFISDLKSTANVHYKCTGLSTAKQVAETLSNIKGVSNRLSTRRMFSMLQESGKNITDIIYAGIINMNLTMFPCIRTYDMSRHHYATWQQNCVWKIISKKDNSELDDILCEVYSRNIIGKLTNENYIHRSKLNTLLESEMPLPWVKPILQRMVHLKIEEDDKESIIQFCSCIALLTNGWFVDYSKIKNLLYRLPLSQLVLQRMKMLSSKLLNDIIKPKLFRIHPSVPIKIKTLPSNTIVSALCTPEKLESNTENETDAQYALIDTLNDNQHEEETNIVRVVEKNVPVSKRLHWSSEEMEIIDFIIQERSQLTRRQMFNAYQSECLKKGVPTRTFSCFRHKIDRCSR